MDVLSFPFRLRPDGSAATVEDGSSQSNAQDVALLCLTRKDERPLVPDYGTSDPVVDLLDVTELNAALATFGPDLLVEGLTVDYPTDLTARVVLTYSE